MAVEPGGGSAFRETIATLPRWATVAVMVVLTGSFALAMGLLLAPDVPKSLRSTGRELLVLSVPLLTAALAVVGAGHTSSQRIDQLTRQFLRKTLAAKLKSYLVGSPGQQQDVRWLDPFFQVMETQFHKDTSSYCRFFFGGHNVPRELEVWVKCNVLNFEINFGVEMPLTVWPNEQPKYLTIGTPDELERYGDYPVVRDVTISLRGALSEGYLVSVDPEKKGDSWIVWWQIRQKITERVILSPVLRRYFAEDAAIFVYFLAWELQGMPDTAVPWSSRRPQ